MLPKEGDDLRPQYLNILKYNRALRGCDHFNNIKSLIDVQRPSCPTSLYIRAQYRDPKGHMKFEWMKNH